MQSVKCYCEADTFFSKDGIRKTVGWSSKMLLILLWYIPGGQEKGGSLSLHIGWGCNRSCKLQSNISVCAKQKRACPRTVVQPALSTRFLSRFRQQGQGISVRQSRILNNCWNVSPIQIWIYWTWFIYFNWYSCFQDFRLAV